MPRANVEKASLPENFHRILLEKKKKKQHITTSAPGPAFAVSQNSLFQSCP